MRNKQKTIYGAVLGLAVAAFIGDRLIGHPAPAAAGASEFAAVHSEVPAAAQQSNLTAGGEAVTAGTTLAGRLQAAAEAQQLVLSDTADAFRPSAAWLPEKPVVELVRTEQASRDLAGEFRHQHHLVAVMKTGQGGIAVVDGKAFVPGQRLDGFKLVSISDRSAVFASSATSVELALAANP